MLLFFDFEVFQKNWLVVIIEPSTETETVIMDNADELRKFYESNKHKIWIGYNSRDYDQFILKGILLGMNPKKINDFIIEEGRKGWQYSREFNKVQLFTFDIMPNPPISLKTLEGFMGSRIKETDVDFNISRKLTPEELRQEIDYCRHDVEETIKVFLKRKKEFDSHLSLITTFKLPLTSISKTQAQLTASILGCEYEERFDEWDIQPVETLRLSKYDFVRQWFLNPVNQDYKKSLTIDVCGIPHTFGWGGLHGAPTEAIHRKGLIIHVDVNLVTWVHDKTY